MSAPVGHSDPQPSAGFDPAATRVDSHQHFFFPERFSYPWMTGSASALRRPLGPEQLRDASAGTGVGRWVTVQAVGDIVETQHLLDLASSTPEMVGVVGWVDLEEPAVGETLARLAGRPGDGRLVGVRHIVHDEPDPGWLDRPAVQRGLQAVGDAGLCYDLLVRARELPAATRAVRTAPTTSFVLDHIAKPPIGREDVALWRDRLSPLAALANVAVKFSGMVTETPPEGWSAADFLPYAAGVLEMFGPDRVLFGSDWPVCTLVSGYAQVFEAAWAALAGAGATTAELDGIFGGNATAIYSLDQPGR